MYYAKSALSMVNGRRMLRLNEINPFLSLSDYMLTLSTIRSNRLRLMIGKRYEI